MGAFDGVLLIGTLAAAVLRPEEALRCLYGSFFSDCAID